MIYDTINKYHILTRFYGQNIRPGYESIVAAEILY